MNDPHNPHSTIDQSLFDLLADGELDAARSRQLLAGSFMDYAMPRADDLPPLDGALHRLRCRRNALGVKGVGEVGTTASLAVMNAVADALPEAASLDIYRRRRRGSGRRSSILGREVSRHQSISWRLRIL